MEKKKTIMILLDFYFFSLVFLSSHSLVIYSIKLASNCTQVLNDRTVISCACIVTSAKEIGSNKGIWPSSCVDNDNSVEMEH